MNLRGEKALYNKIINPKYVIDENGRNVEEITILSEKERRTL